MIKHYIIATIILSLQIASFCIAAPVVKKDKSSEVVIKKDLSKNIQERRLFTFDLGFGLPQLINAELAVRAFRRWQFGVGYGLLPGGSFNLPLNLGRQSLELASGDTAYFDDPQISTALSTIAGFVRFFPSENMFYFQFSFNVMLSKNHVSSGMSDETGTKLSDGLLDGTIYMRQYIPTVSIGQFFTGNLIFFNVNLGLSYTGWSVVDHSEMGGSIPAKYGGTAANEAAFKKLDSKMADASRRGMDEIRKVLPFVPSLSILFGFWL